MKIRDLYTTQKNLKRKNQVPVIMANILTGEYIHPILLSKTEDGNIQVENGHHRLVAYYLSGREVLFDYEYVLLESSVKPSIMKFEKFVGFVV